MKSSILLLRLFSADVRTTWSKANPVGMAVFVPVDIAFLAVDWACCCCWGVLVAGGVEACTEFVLACDTTTLT